MTTERFEPLRLLLRQQTVAALGTLHRGEPYVSMVPFALDEAVPEFLIHVSALSPHTRDMLEHPRVSLLVVATDNGGRPQARARATIQGDAVPLGADSARYAAARALYLQRSRTRPTSSRYPTFRCSPFGRSRCASSAALRRR